VLVAAVVATLGAASVAQASVNSQVPTLSGAVSTGNTYDPRAVFFDVTGAIPLQGVVLTITQLGGAATTTTVNATADGTGIAHNLTPSPQLAAGEYAATAHTVDAGGTASAESAPVTFFVSLAEPVIAAIGGQPAFYRESLNQSVETVTVSGVVAGADVKLYAGSEKTGDTALLGEQTAAGGTVDFQASGLPEGYGVLYATQTVPMNGTPVTSAAGELEIRVTTTAPHVSSEDVADGGTTADSQPSFEATGASPDGWSGGSGAEFVVKQGARTIVTSLPGGTDGGGDAGWQPETPLADGTYTVTALSVDDTGHVNTAAPSNIYTFTVDTSVPACSPNCSQQGGSGDPTPPVASNPPVTTTPPVNPTPPTKTAPPAKLVISGTLTARHPVTVTLTVTKPGPVVLKLIGKVHGKTKVIGTVTVRATRAGSVSYRLTTRFDGHRLSKGAYTLIAKVPVGKTLQTKLNVR
jgi:hypothetical protein